MAENNQQWELLYEVCSRTLNHAPEGGQEGRRGQRSSWGFRWGEPQEVSLTVRSSSITFRLLSLPLCSRDLRDKDHRGWGGSDRLQPVDHLQWTVFVCVNVMMCKDLALRGSSMIFTLTFFFFFFYE